MAFCRPKLYSWVYCTITYLVTVFYEVNLPLKNYLTSMLIVNDGNVGTIVDGPYWTLTFERLFYFFVGIFVYLFSTRNIVWFYFGWLWVSISVFCSSRRL